MMNKSKSKRCPLCSRVIPPELFCDYLIKAHLDQSKQRCPFCSRTFLGERLCEHMKSLHALQLKRAEGQIAGARLASDATTKSRCPQCNRDFNSQNSLMKHWYVHHGGGLDRFLSVCQEARLQGVRMFRGGRASPR